MSFDRPDQSSVSAEGLSQYSSSRPLPSQPVGMTFTNTETTSATQPGPIQPAMLSTSASAPEIQRLHSLNASSVPFSPSLDSALMQSSRNSSAEALQGTSTAREEGSGNTSPMEPDVAPIIEALRSKDRIWLLQLADQMESLINERRERFKLNPSTTYQRMLVHRCSAYYKLTPETEQNSRAIIVHYHAESKIPTRRVCELVPAEESTQPAFKIMRRTPQDRRMRQTSQPGSVTGDDADISDIDPSETSSVGGRSSATGSGKRHPTIAEREAAYNEARSRIFEGFEKEKDSSANSSTLSLISGSGGRSSTGDGDDAASAATESEWSSSATRDRRDGKRGGSSRSQRSGQTSYNASASGSSRNSRATSPSYGYPPAALYDPSADLYQPVYSPPQQYMPYFYPAYMPQGPGQPYLNPYNYTYPAYGYPPSQQPPTQHSDPVTPAGGDQAYASQSPPHMAYQQPYIWPFPPPGHPLPQATSPNGPNANLPGPPPPQPSPNQMPPQGMMNHPGYYPPGYPPPYPMAPYYPPPSQQMPPPPPLMPSQPYYPDGQHLDARFANGTTIDNMNHSRTSSRNSNGHGSMNGNGRRGGHAPQRRAPWSYPTTGAGGMTTGPSLLPDSVGPRLSNRRTSSGSQSTGNRTPGDEASSVTSSTSSSSRRTFTSTSTSSKQHPLPARPDWAVGLKAQPTLSGPRHHDHSNSNSRTMSPARLPGHLPNVPYQHPPQSQLQQPPSQSQHPVLQATDFPPLSSGPEKKTPVIGGAWTNSSGMRSALRAGPATSPAIGGAQSLQPCGASLNSHPEGQDPALKTGNEASVKSANGGNVQEQPARADSTGESAAGLADRLGEMSLTANRGDIMPTSISPSTEVISVSTGGAS